MKKFISFSGGVESTTMCILYGKGAVGIWCDTGAEHQEMYQRIEHVESELKKLHDGDFSIIKVKNNKHKGLEDYAKQVKFMPSGQRRYCTRMFKIEPIDDFLKTQGECELLIGFNADEDGRVGNLEKMSNVNYRYPLIDDGYDRADCEIILKKNNLHPNFPAYMKRGGCRMCFFKSEKEYKALYYLNKPEFDEIVKFEKDIQDKRLKFYSIMPSGKSLVQLAEECQNEMDFNYEEMYNSLKDSGKTCGAFCHR